MRALLDVNVLIALLDEAHVAHDRATAWLRNDIEHGWASCPITQNGCIRVMSQPAYPGSIPAAEVAARLADAASNRAHQFWPDEVSLLDAGVFNWSHVLGPRQVTDTYLLALAVRRQGRFITFDGRVSLAAAAGAVKQQLVVLS